MGAGGDRMSRPLAFAWLDGWKFSPGCGAWFAGPGWELTLDGRVAILWVGDPGLDPVAHGFGWGPEARACEIEDVARFATAPPEAQHAFYLVVAVMRRACGAP